MGDPVPEAMMAAVEHARRGDPGSGVPLVLLHAFPLSSAMWSAQAAASATGARVVTPDQRGFGGSPLGDDEPSLDHVADDVAALLDRLGLEHVVLGGLSMGGYVAMAFLRRHPGRVRALVLADTKAGADPDAAREKRLAMADRLERDGTPQALLDDVLPGADRADDGPGAARGRRRGCAQLVATGATGVGGLGAARDGGAAGLAGHAARGPGARARRPRGRGRPGQR